MFLGTWLELFVSYTQRAEPMNPNLPQHIFISCIVKSCFIRQLSCCRETFLITTQLFFRKLLMMMAHSACTLTTDETRDTRHYTFESPHTPHRTGGRVRWYRYCCTHPFATGTMACRRDKNSIMAGHLCIGIAIAWLTWK
jgi:hypothetical protein